ncbi:hypothetical protein CPB86DRAFT_814614 [Serendipita vermifera]|nr:hypothetical protein CPB86DRAFT_814614 [Serendipita vermifera]
MSYPITTSQDQRLAFEKLKETSHDHFMAFIGGCEFDIEDLEDVQVLFIDLTPGRVAAVLGEGTIHNRRWLFGEEKEKVVLGDVPKLSAQDVIDELIVPIVPKPSALHGVGVLRPDGAFPELLPIKLELELPNVPFKWLSLADLSYGSAGFLYHHLTMDHEFRCGTRRHDKPTDFSIRLADGRFRAIIPFCEPIIEKNSHFFTTSKDNQVTATLQFMRGNSMYQDIVVQGLTPHLKGVSRIKVSIEEESYHQTEIVVKIQEMGSNLNIKATLMDVVRTMSEWAYIARVGISVQRAEMAFGEDGIIGELPE